MSADGLSLPVSAAQLKQVARRRIDAERNSLVELSHRIHAHPELGFAEERACRWLCEALDAAGFEVERGICDLPTAFVARRGRGPLRIAICAEYDSLPRIGHACGHNIIAAAALGAALGAASVADETGLTITVLGTPAEEVGDAGGKILLLERGGFRDLHAAMMVHPAPVDVADPVIIAATTFEVRYIGKEAHASAFPQLGVNAADALTVAQAGIGLLRQHLRSGDRVHGIITNGGAAANVVPALTQAQYMVRAATLADLDEVVGKVRRCFEAGSLATGAQLQIAGGDKPYAEMRSEPSLVAFYQRNAEALGRHFPPLSRSVLRRAAGSTDMGNVSLVLPAIHPMLGLNSLPAVNHQPEFAAYCITPEADRAVYDGAVAMAWTAIDAACEAEVRARLLGGICN